MSKFWVVCYDVRDDKRRTKLAKRLERYCERVQYSAFECPLPEKKIQQLLPRWLDELELREDSLRVYPLDALSKEKAMVYGSPQLYEPPDYLIL